MTTTEQTAYLFLSGAEMEPTAVRTAYPDARFVARARIAANGATVAPAFASHLDGDVWGILIRLPGTIAATNRRKATTDDGRPFETALPGTALVDGEPSEALAAARYWELPPAYVARLKAALAATDEDPSDGN
ncbi:MAG: hypothetical protein QOG89_110 [Thermomicrobiales bacterium]|nr:hypothetical protein [Thermomicrobiales bacterium]